MLVSILLDHWMFLAYCIACNDSMYIIAYNIFKDLRLVPDAPPLWPFLPCFHWSFVHHPLVLCLAVFHSMHSMWEFWVFFCCFWCYTNVQKVWYTQLTGIIHNITTNEKMNQGRYLWLHAPDGSFHNPFDKGFVSNIMEFFFYRKDFRNVFISDLRSISAE